MWWEIERAAALTAWMYSRVWPAFPGSWPAPCLFAYLLPHRWDRIHLMSNYITSASCCRGVRQCGFYSTCTVLSLSQNKIQPTEKSSSKGCQPSSSPLSSSSTPSWERRQRGRRERGIRVRIRGLLHCRQHGKKMHLDRNLQIKSNDRNILRNVHIFSGFKYS